MCGFDRLDISFTNNHLVLPFPPPMTKIQCPICIVHVDLSVRDEQTFLNAGTLCTYRLLNDTQTSIYSHVHVYTWLKQFL